MALGDKVLTGLYDNVTQVIDQQITSNVTALSYTALPLITAAIMCYCVFVAYKIITGQNDMFISEIIHNLVVFSLVGAVCYSSSYYQRYVIPFVLGAGDDLSSSLFGPSAVGTSALDSFLEGVNKSLDVMESKMTFGWLDDWSLGMQAVIYWVILWLAAGVFAVYATAYLLVAKFMVGILLSVGTIFICFSMFPATRGMFTAWVNQCANYIFLTLGYSLVLSIFLQFINTKFSASSSNGSSTPFADVAQIVMVLFIGVYIMGQVGSLISSITGGVGINGLNHGVSGGLRAGGKGIRSLLGSNKVKSVASRAKEMGQNVMDKIKGRGGIGG